MEFRFVREDDTEGLLDIYRQYIDTTITFEYVLPTVDEFRERIRHISKDYPYIVCIEEDKLLGYAYAHQYKERAAFKWNVEFSIYLDKSLTAKGVGTKMYDILFEIVKLQGIKNVYSLISCPNEPSVRLHEKMGFELLVTYKNDGYKNGQWKDLMCYRKTIAPYDEVPEDIKTIYQLDSKVLEEILNKL